MPSRLETLQTFVDFCKEHIQGDEKGEAQSFLNEFFRAFDYAGALQAGAVFEERIKKGSKKGKTGFADLVWKPRVLVEMKKRGTDLSKHYSQAFDYFIFGILTSDIHRIWAKAQSSRLGPSLRYTPRSCLETFPFPQSPTLSIISKIKAQAVELQKYRSDQMEKKQWGLTALYNAYFDEPASQLYKLHNHLNDLVAEAYGFSDSDDILERLLEMNLELADKEKKGEAVTGPQHYQ